MNGRIVDNHLHRDRIVPHLLSNRTQLALKIITLVGFPISLLLWPFCSYLPHDALHSDERKLSYCTCLMECRLTHRVGFVTASKASMERLHLLEADNCFQ